MLKRFDKRENKFSHLPLKLGKFRDKRGIVSSYLPWLLIAVAVLVILMIVSFIMKDQGVSLIDQIKNLFRGR